MCGVYALAAYSLTFVMTSNNSRKHSSSLGLAPLSVVLVNKSGICTYREGDFGSHVALTVISAAQRIIATGTTYKVETGKATSWLTKSIITTNLQN